MTEISRDGKRVYFHNCWTAPGTQFYPDGRARRAGMCNVMRTAASARPGILCSTSEGIRSAPDPLCRAATVRPIRSATHRLEPDAALWLTIVAIGLYHGSPGDGMAARPWLTAWRHGASAPFATVFRSVGGHFAAMAVVRCRLRGLSWYVEWEPRDSASGGGRAGRAVRYFKLIERRHPRALSADSPDATRGWSFLMATAHGAG